MSELSRVDLQKKRAAEHAVSLIETNMKVGLGTGTTARFAVAALGRRVREEGLKLKAVPTSEATRLQALEEGITIVSFDHVDRLDICFDGADEVDPKLNLTKGGGGALLRALGGEPTLRQKNGATFVTDNGLWILDCRFAPITDPPLLAQAFERIPGIAEHGLFCGMVHDLIVGTDDGVTVTTR